MSDQSLQILREIDKLDKLGVAGVCAMLGEGMKDTSGAFNPGVGLMPIQVGMIRLFLTETTGHASNEATLAAMKEAMGRLSKIRCRIDLMAALEETIVDAGGTTAWDRLLAMTPNSDETWNNRGRPANIAWALDDLSIGMRVRE
jgi:hypothetical protein